MTGPAILETFLRRNADVAIVRLKKVRGSCPREAGATIYVAAHETYGTIGGGQLEYMMIDEARAMLARGEDLLLRDVPLGPEIGQCCGGRVEVAITRVDAVSRQAELELAEREWAAQPHVYILGAGHVGRALAGLFAVLPVRTILVDQRAEELSKCIAKVESRNSVLPESDISRAPPSSAFVVLTHDHALDFLLTAHALSRGDAAYVGLIGSATKRERFCRWCRDHRDGQPTDALVCPIGAMGGDDKRPAVIATFVAAEVMAALTEKTSISAPHGAKFPPVAG